jgi:hypothetical protein
VLTLFGFERRMMLRRWSIVAWEGVGGEEGGCRAARRKAAPVQEQTRRHLLGLGAREVRRGAGGGRGLERARPLELRAAARARSSTARGRCRAWRGLGWWGRW